MSASKSITPLKIQEYQRKHFRRIKAITEQYPCYMDFSIMGTGKTYITGGVSIVRKLHLLIVCPPTANGAWRRIEKDHGVKIIDILSYNSLRGTEQHPPRHGLLKRTDIEHEHKKITTFTPTPDLMDLIKEGILVVFDEAQNLKNKTAQTKAAIAITNAIIKANGGFFGKGTKSRFAYLSGSPFDKEEHAENVLRFMGLIQHHNLYWVDPKSKEVVLKGIEELLSACRVMNKAKTDELRAEVKTFNKTTSRSLCYKLFVEVVKPFVVSEMPPLKINHALNVSDAYYMLDEEKSKALEKAIRNLASAARYKNGDVFFEEVDWSGVQKALHEIEQAKLDTLIKAGMKVLKEKPTNKIVLCCKFLDTVRGLTKAFSEYDPLVINGDVEKSLRTQYAEKFREDDNYRVIIMTIKSGGVSLSLHDTKGDRERYMFICPGYSIIDIYQCVFRVYRNGQKSDAHIKLVYGDNEKHTLEEAPILRSLIRKKEVLKSVLDEQTKNRKLPGEYPRENITF